MVNPYCYQIYEFSQYDEADGSRPYGTRLSGGMTWEDVPQVLKDAKISLEDQLLHREVRPDPCVFGQLLPGYNSENHKVWYALVAVAHLYVDRFGRPLTALRYFWCECRPGEECKGLQAIVYWFSSKVKHIPLWNRQDTLYQNPSSFYEVQKSFSPGTRPELLEAHLLLPTYGKDLQPLQALQKLNHDVVATLFTLYDQNPHDSYSLAWGWNVSDLNNVNGWFIKPVDVAAYNRLKPRVPEIIWDADSRTLSSTSIQRQLTSAGHSITPIAVGSSPTMSLKDALKSIAEQFPKDFDHQPNVERFRRFLEALEQGLSTAELKQLQKDFRDLGCTRTLWEDAQKKDIDAKKLRFLFLWTLLLPTEIPDKAKSDQNIDHLIAVLTKSPNYQQKQEDVKSFLLAICKTVLELSNVDLYQIQIQIQIQIQNLTLVTVSVLDLTCFFFGKLFANDRKNHNSSETKKLQNLFKSLLQETTWICFLEIALCYVTQKLPKDTPISQSLDWKDFEETLRRHIHRYLAIWNEHQKTYQNYINQRPHDRQKYESEWFDKWPEAYRKKRESNFFWSPLFKDSDILAALETYERQQHRQEDWWALRWQALFEHLDKGYSTVKGWPEDRLLPGGIPFFQKKTPTTLQIQDVVQALTIISEKYTSLDNTNDQQELKKALDFLNNLDSNYDRFSEDFQRLGCDYYLWKQPTKRDEELGLLFLWTLILPHQQIINNKLNFDYLLDLLIAQDQDQKKLNQFVRAICKTLNPSYSHCTRIDLNLLDLTCFFLGELFFVYYQNSKSQKTQEIQALFKNLLQESSWIRLLEIALNGLTQNSKDTSISQSKDWQDFKEILQQNINNYLDSWRKHKQKCETDNENERNRKWIKQYKEKHSSSFWISMEINSIARKVSDFLGLSLPKVEESQEERFLWKPLLEDSGILDKLENYLKKALKDKKEEWWALHWRALLEHLDNGYSTVNGWPKDKLLPEKIVFVPSPKLSLRDFVIVFVIVMIVGLILKKDPSPPDFAQLVLSDINDTVGFQNSSGIAVNGQAIIQPNDLASALANTLEESREHQSLIKVNAGSLVVGSNALTQSLENYLQLMGIERQTVSETADSLLCLTLDRLIRGQSSSIVSPDPSKPITSDTLDEKITACSDERLFIDRQMYIAHQRFWFGEILTWTQQEADVENPKRKIIQFLQRFDPNLSDRIQFSPKDPVKQRQLLKAFYQYSLTDKINGALGISDGLIRPETLERNVDELTTSEVFFCAFSKAENLNLPACTADESAAGSLPTNTPNPVVSPLPTAVATTQPGDIYAGVPDDVKSFVDRYSDEWAKDPKEVLSSLKTELDISLSAEPTAAVWQEKIKLFQRRYRLPEDGRLVPSGTTESNLAIELFGAVTPP